MQTQHLSYTDEPISQSLIHRLLQASYPTNNNNQPALRPQTACYQCDNCCYQDIRCGTQDECSKTNMTFVIVLVSIIVLLVLILITWCYFIHRRNVNQKNRILQKMMEHELKQQNQIKRHGIVLGSVVPKNIPMKMANVYSSFDLEHLKNVKGGGMGNLFDKGISKKVYMQLHKAIKGDGTTLVHSGGPGPMTAPGQKVKIFDMRDKGGTLNQKGKSNDIEMQIRDLEKTSQVNSSRQKAPPTDRKLKISTSPQYLQLNQDSIIMESSPNQKIPKNLLQVQSKKLGQSTRNDEVAQLARELGE